ncbi:MAG: hypothetical protein EKK29_09455 [Hyphomicrobiales bacterium]|nr:MAG: hypothetical protein EKK29_09455 [Hyphomicrobiales bacterium]
MAEALRYLAERKFFTSCDGVATDANGRITEVGWISAGMALKLAYLDDGEELWSLTHNSDEARAEAAAHWKSFATAPNGNQITIGTLINAARDAGFKFPNREHDSGYVTFGGSAKRIVLVEDVDARFGQLEAPGLPACYIHRLDSMAITPDDLHKRLGGEVVYSGKDEKGRPKYGPAANAWKNYINRHRYRRIVFTNKTHEPEDSLNLFRGLGVVPKKGDCSLIVRHIFEVICSGDFDNGMYLIKLIAWQLQNIGKPSRVIVLLKSEQQQVGKGLLVGEVLRPIFGDAFSTSNIKLIIGRFKDHLRGKSLIFLDEALFAGNREGADLIKAFATASFESLEPKGLPPLQLPVAFNFWLCSNHEDAAYIEKFDARYFVLNVSPHRYGGTAYFDAVLDEAKNGGREAFADYLLSLDLSDFNPVGDMPKSTAAKRAMQWESINPYDSRKLLEACAHSRKILGSGKQDYLTQDWVVGAEHSFADLSLAYAAWQKTVSSPVKPRPTKIGALGGVLSKAGFESKHTNEGNFRILPTPEACLELLLA